MSIRQKYRPSTDKNSMLLDIKDRMYCVFQLNGKTALHLACEAKKTRAARFLLCCGADTGVQDKVGY